MKPKSIVKTFPTGENELWDFDTWLKVGQIKLEYYNSIEEDDKEVYSKELLYTQKFTIGELLELKSYFDGFMYFNVTTFRDITTQTRYLIETRDLGYDTFEDLKETLAYLKKQYTHFFLHKISDYIISFSKLNLVSYDNINPE